MAKRETIKGKDLMAFANGKAFALATSCDIELTANTEDAASKDTGGWDNPEIVGHGWKLNTDCLCGATAATAKDLSYDEVMALCIAGTPIAVMFGIAANAADTDVPDDGWTVPTAGWQGNAVITSVKVTAANKQKGTFTVAMDGKGELKAIKA
jgi:hypothetical protein